MEATLCLSKLSPSRRPTTIINHDHYVSLHNPPTFRGDSLRARPQQVYYHQKADVVGAYLTMPVGPMSLSGALKTCPKIVGMKDPIAGKRRIILPRVPAWRSLILEGLKRGGLSLKVLVEAQQAHQNPQSLKGALSELDGLLKELKKPDLRFEFDLLEKVARKLEMAGEEDSAVKALKIFLDPSNSDGLGSIEIYEVKLILVEMLIYQGSYEEARDMCKKLEEEEHEATMINSSSFPPEVNVPVERINYAVHHRLKLYQAVAGALCALNYWEELEHMSMSYGKGVTQMAGDVDEDEHPSLEERPEITMWDYEGDDEKEGHPHKSKDAQFLDHIKKLKDEIDAVKEAKSVGNKSRGPISPQTQIDTRRR